MRARPLVLILSVTMLMAAAPALMAQGGHFEFGGHYGRWTLNILGNKAVELLDDATKDEFQQAIEDKIAETHPNLFSTQFSQDIDFDSSGDDFAFGIRWYPGGHRGSFSLGVSVERSTFKVLPTAVISMQLQDGVTSDTATYTGDAEASALIKATAFLLSFRWDIFPSKAVHPYITFGLGASTSKALDDSVLSYSYTGTLAGTTIPAETVAGSESKTLRELRDEALEEEETEFPIPNFLPFVRLNLGLKARLTKMVHILIDVGVYDGFMASAGLAIRL